MKNEVEVSKEKDAFEAFWSAYPKRAGGNPKKTALSRWRTNVKAGVDPADMIAGAGRYAAYCEATGKTNTEYVKQASTFLGQDEGWTESWVVPEVERVKPQSEEITDANRMAEARSRATTQAIDTHRAEGAEAEAQKAELREFYDNLPTADQRTIMADVNRRARMIQPTGTLTQMAMAGCFAQVVGEHQQKGAA